MPKTKKKSAKSTQQPSALSKLLRAGTDAKRMYNEPEFRELVAATLLFAAKALRGTGGGGKRSAKSGSVKRPAAAQPAKKPASRVAKKAKAKAPKAGAKNAASKAPRKTARRSLKKKA